jgi:hypothetical protein
LLDSGGGAVAAAVKRARRSAVVVTFDGIIQPLVPIARLNV